MEVYLH